MVDLGMSLKETRSVAPDAGRRVGLDYFGWVPVFFFLFGRGMIDGEEGRDNRKRTWCSKGSVPSLLFAGPFLE